MALVFKRKEFKGGVMVVKESVKEKGVDGKETDAQYETVLKPNDQGKSFVFKDEAAVLKKYPAFKKA